MANTKFSPSSQYNPKRHMFPPVVQDDNDVYWQNDGQNYIFCEDGKVRTYSLAKPDFQFNNGFPNTGWLLYEGDTIDTMQSVEMGIPADSSLGNSWWSGSVFIDKENLLGEGRGTIFYFISGPAPFLQGISVLISNSFYEEPYFLGMCCAPPIVPEDWRDGGSDFRDCRVFWDYDNNYLVMATTIGSSYMFLKSYNGKQWEVLSKLDGPGPLVECPNMYYINAYDINGNIVGGNWCILGAVQGTYEGSTDSNESCTYWLGNWDGTTFTPEEGFSALPIDYGPDSYATVGGTDGENVYCGCWLGNWNYAMSEEGYLGFQNIQGFPRTAWIQLDSDGNKNLYTLPFTDNDNFVSSVESLNVDGNMDTSNLITSDCYRLDVQLKNKYNEWPQVEIRVCAGSYEGKDYYTSYIINQDGTIVMDRSNSSVITPTDGDGNIPEDWIKTYSIPNNFNILDNDTIQLSFFIDTSSIELFVNGGITSMSTIVFPPEGATGVSLKTNSPLSVSMESFTY